MLELALLDVQVVVGRTTASQRESHERISVFSPLVTPRVTSIFSVGIVTVPILIVSDREELPFLKFPLQDIFIHVRVFDSGAHTFFSHETVFPLPNLVTPENPSGRILPLPLCEPFIMAPRSDSISVTLFT